MPENDMLKSPPYSEEAEKSVLGCMMLDRQSVETAVYMLTEDDFYIEKNRWIFSAIAEINRRGGAVDYVTIMDMLTTLGTMGRVGASYIAELQEIVPFTKNIEQYCAIVKEKSVLRKIIIEYSNLINKCYEGKSSLPEIIDESERFIYDLSMNSTSNSFVSVK